MGVYSGADSEVPKEVDPGKHLRTQYYESVSAPEGRIPVSVFSKLSLSLCLRVV